MQQGSLNETILLNALRDDDHTTSLEEHVGTFNMEPVYKDVQSSSKGEAHESQATEIHRLRLEVSALKAQTERIVQSEALRTKKMVNIPSTWSHRVTLVEYRENSSESRR